MPMLSPEEAYELIREVSERERSLRAEADLMLTARDQLMAQLDGQPGIRRAGLAAACGLSRSRVTWMLNHGSVEGTDEAVAVPAALRRAIESIRPDLGRVRTLGTRAA